VALSRVFANQEVMAAGGFLHVRDPEKAGWLVRFQFVEYLKAFIWRVGFAEARICLQVSGAFGGFRRTELVKLGGFDETSLVEDYEIIYRMHECYRAVGRHSDRIVVGEMLSPQIRRL
jgi:cellulose synthase/poly-beta-1,6-N-acetylglucosamine synthase-like glycosyltransferase